MVKLRTASQNTISWLSTELWSVLLSFTQATAWSSRYTRPEKERSSLWSVQTTHCQGWGFDSHFDQLHWTSYPVNTVQSSEIQSVLLFTYYLKTSAPQMIWQLWSACVGSHARNHREMFFFLINFFSMFSASSSLSSLPLRYSLSFSFSLSLSCFWLLKAVTVLRSSLVASSWIFYDIVK